MKIEKGRLDLVGQNDPSPIIEGFGLGCRQRCRPPSLTSEIDLGPSLPPQASYDHQRHHQ